jgi:HEAT repeat protein
VLGLALLNPVEQPQIRLAAAEALAALATPAAVAALGALIEGEEAPPVLRRHAVDALLAIVRSRGGSAAAARTVLARSAAADVSVERRSWAAEALIGC